MHKHVIIHLNTIVLIFFFFYSNLSFDRATLEFRVPIGHLATFLSVLKCTDSYLIIFFFFTRKSFKNTIVTILKEILIKK